MIKKVDTNWRVCDAFIWRGDYLHPVKDFNSFELDDLVGIDEQKETLIKNTESFINNKGGLNAFLYGPRGCGKSTLIRAIFTKFAPNNLKMVQIGVDDIKVLPVFVDNMRTQPHKFIIFCDDLSFEADDTSYKFLKVLLDGSMEKIPNNIILYVTSNKKYLISDVNDNLDTKAQSKENSKDSMEEKISLSDRFSINIAFYRASVDDYLKILEVYFKSELDEDLKKQAISYALKRGSRNGRVALDFYRAKSIGLI